MTATTTQGRTTRRSAYLDGWNFAAWLVDEMDRIKASRRLDESELLRLWLNVLQETRSAFDSEDEYGNGMLAALWAVSEDNPDDVLLPSYEQHVPAVGPGASHGNSLVFTYRMTKVPGVVKLLSVNGREGEV